MKNVYYKRTTTKSPNDATEGETIESKIRRMVSNGEPLSGDGAPLLYTEKKDGVVTGYNPRGDRWDKALEGGDMIAKSLDAKGQSARMEVVKEEEKSPESESAGGTNV